MNCNFIVEIKGADLFWNVGGGGGAVVSPDPSRGIQRKIKGEGHRGRLVGLNEGRRTEPGRVWEGVSQFFLNKHVKEALIEHPTTRNDGMEDLRPAVMVQYVGDRLKLLNDGRSVPLPSFD